MTELEQKVFDSLAILIGGDGTKKLKPSALIKRLSKVSGLVQTDVKQGLKGLVLQGKLLGVNRYGEPLELVGWSDPTIHPTPQYRFWLNEILEGKKDELTEEQVRTILRSANLFDGLSQTELERLITSVLGHARRKIAIDSEDVLQDKFIRSAKSILSSSKAIDSLSKILIGLGCELPIDSPTYYALTAGDPNATKIMFVENPRVFNFLIAYADRFDAFLVSSYGYGLTMANIGFLISKNKVVACSVDAYPNSNLSSVLEGKTCLYWGDLDYEGIQIYECLKKSIPSLALSGAYEYMVEILHKGDGHPYHKLFGKNGQTPSKCLTAEGDWLMRLCEVKKHGVDQEAICSARYLDQIFTSSRLHQNLN